ncbi:hypothetical protein D3C84_548380 [compost metagenome]
MQPDVGRLLGAVDGQRRAPFAGDATDVRGNRLAAAGVHAVDAVHALEHVARVAHLKALQLLAAFVDAGDVLLVDLVVALGVFILCARNDGRRQLDPPLVGSLFFLGLLFSRRHCLGQHQRA